MDDSVNSVQRRISFFDSVIGRPALVGMIHVQALPGTPKAELELDQIVKLAVTEALDYRAAGFDGVALENMHDRPYLKGRVGPEITAAMTRVAVEVRAAVGKGYPLGVQILAGANTEALAVALAAELEFIRAEGCLFGHVADEGWIESCAGELLRERRRLGAAAEKIQIWTDIQKKHSAHAVTGDLDIADWVAAADFFEIDGVIVTGAATGAPADSELVNRVRKLTSRPLIVGSGVTAFNAELYRAADALIVGSSLKQDGYWANPLDPAALEQLVAAVKRNQGRC